MRGQGVLLAAIFVPIIGSFLLPCIGKRSPKMRNMMALALMLVSLVFSSTMVPAVSVNAPFQWKLALPWGFDLGFLADGLALFMAITTSFLGCVVVFYSWGYMDNCAGQDEYYMMVALFFGAILGLIYSTSLLYLYLFWEVAGLCCWRLFRLKQGKQFVLEADRAVLAVMIGALLLLWGFLQIYATSGTFSLVDMSRYEVSGMTVSLILGGIFLKFAALPLSTCVPEEKESFFPVTALLHAAVFVQMGVYVFARIFLVNIGLPELWKGLLPGISIILTLLAGGAALASNNMKRAIAYAALSQMGFILMGLSCANGVAVTGALLYIGMLSLATAGLFLCTGIVEHSIHTNDLRKMGGLWRNLPMAATAFLLCAFSIMGVPPLGGFWANYMVIAGAANTGNLWLALIFIVASLLTVIYLCRLFAAVFMGPAHYVDNKEGTWEMVLAGLLLAGLSIAAGVFIQGPSDLIQVILDTMEGVGI